MHSKGLKTTELEHDPIEEKLSLVSKDKKEKSHLSN